MLLAAVNYDNSLSYALTFLLGSVAMVSTLHTYRNLRRLSFRSEQCRAVFKGSHAEFPIRVTNLGPGERLAVSLAFPGIDEVVIDIPKGESCRAVLKMPARRRGWLTVSRITVSTRYPLGLFRAWGYLSFDQRCLVYPSPASHAPQLERLGAGGDGTARKQTGTEDFAELRPYRPGDSLRQIHWKAWAGKGELVTKQFTAEAGQDLWFRFERLPRVGTEARLQLLCRLVLDAERSGAQWLMELPGQRIGPATGAAHCRQCLKALALFQRSRP